MSDTTYPPDGSAIRGQVIGFQERAASYVSRGAAETKAIEARASAIAQRLVSDRAFQNLSTRELNARALDDARQEYSTAREQEQSEVLAGADALLREISTIEAGFQAVKLPPVTVGESEAVTSFDRSVIREQRETRRSIDLLISAQEYAPVRDVGELLQAIEVETAANNLLAVAYLDQKISRLIAQTERQLNTLPHDHPERRDLESMHRQHEREFAKIRAARMPEDRREFWARRRAEIQSLVAQVREMAADERIRFGRGAPTDEQINALFEAQRAARLAGTRQ